ncbi:vegetative incompatibility protein HET-E-1 [Venturia nashicola]|uniref:Vegetative incompatibility protein HET-E-1 n=1 Tax=Venturia nashicola TaxID=86259 RepID=A0A4Z1PA54_9PEZI|nr:vegetative incompatibility protein HET-E-1 [Venturia nashicola]TLD34693.1 vegetative incompatibility protein HET-E-1 [Venturia nashicola]
MPMLFGEGAINAFLRVQDRILKVFSDETLFAWQAEPSAIRIGALLLYPRAAASSAISNEREAQQVHAQGPRLGWTKEVCKWRSRSCHTPGLLNSEEIL